MKKKIIIDIPNDYTPSFNRYKNILMEFFPVVDLSNDECGNIYMMTRYITDEELKMINDARTIKGLPKLPRLSRARGGNYIIVNSQKDRVYHEAQISEVKINPTDTLVANVEEIYKQTPDSDF